uniref:Uncharacterized protein n=1 Tax=Arundo donax TaxID=35708 RepID=A0A0A9BEY2_ARUDO
MRSAGSRGKRL